MARFTWEKVEDLKMEHCYIAPNYVSEAQLFQKGTKEVEDKAKCWQVPWLPSAVEEPPSEEEIARKAAIKERQRQRLREMALLKGSSKINELKNPLHDMMFLLRQLEQVEDNEIPSFPRDTDYASKQEIEPLIVKKTETLRKAKGEPKAEHGELEETSDSSTHEKYPLPIIPDDKLNPEQMKEKKKEAFLKTMAHGQQQAKQKHREESTG